MSWSLSKTLYRTGAPALGMFLAHTGFDIFNLAPGANLVEEVSSNALLYGVIWLGVAALLYLIYRIFPAPI